jgi:hypothetical protein
MIGFRQFEDGSSAEFSHEEHLLVLQGRVLECFHTGAPWQSQRIHVSQLSVYVAGPDRKRRTEFKLQPLGADFNALTVKVPPERVDDMKRFVGAMIAARDGAGTS